MKLSDFTPARVAALYNSRTSLMLQGSPGTGKTSLVRTWPAMLSELFGEDFGYHCVHPGNREATELKGYMIPAKDKDGRAIVQFTWPAIFPSREYLAAHPRGILNLEELDQAPQDTAKVLAQVILENRLDDVVLPEGWWVVCTGNSVSHRSGAVRQMAHIVNRQRRIVVENDIDGLCAWMSAHGVHPMVIAFARARPGIVFTNTVPADPEPFCTPRSLVSAAMYMQQVVGSDSMDFRVSDFDQEAVAGDIGKAASVELFAYAEVRDRLPDIEDVHRRPETAKLPPSEALDAVYATAELLIHHIAPGNAEATLKYVTRLPRQFQLSIIGRCLKKMPSIVALPDVAQWISRNKEVISASVR